MHSAPKNKTNKPPLYTRSHHLYPALQQPDQSCEPTRVPSCWFGSTVLQPVPSNRDIKSDPGCLDTRAAHCREQSLKHHSLKQWPFWDIAWKWAITRTWAQKSPTRTTISVTAGTHVGNFKSRSNASGHQNISQRSRFLSNCIQKSSSHQSQALPQAKRETVFANRQIDRSNIAQWTQLFFINQNIKAHTMFFSGCQLKFSPISDITINSLKISRLCCIPAVLCFMLLIFFTSSEWEENLRQSSVAKTLVQ